MTKSKVFSSRVKKTARRSLDKLTLKGASGKKGKGKGKDKGKGKAMIAAGLVAAAGVAAGVAAARASRSALKPPRPGETVIHVEHDGQRWRVRFEGTSTPSSVHANKKEATTTGREAARSHAPSRLVIHSLEGKVLDSHDYPAEG